LERLLISRHDGDLGSKGHKFLSQRLDRDGRIWLRDRVGREGEGGGERAGGREGGGGGDFAIRTFPSPLEPPVMRTCFPFTSSLGE
jgi:hypothetical protein